MSGKLKDQQLVVVEGMEEEEMVQVEREGRERRERREFGDRKWD